MALYAGMIANTTGQKSEPAVQLERGDRRFNAEAWRANRWYSLLKQTYLLNARLFNDMVEASGAGEKEKPLRLPGRNGATLEQSKQEKAMTNSDPTSTFRGLPLTAEQDAEVRHDIKVRTQRGLPWDTSELNAMLKDMLQPPGDGNDESDAPADETKAAAGRAMASVDEAMEPIEASEERNAAMESESMKGPKR
jgi:hypothetical protein